MLRPSRSKPTEPDVMKINVSCRTWALGMIANSNCGPITNQYVHALWKNTPECCAKGRSGRQPGGQTFSWYHCVHLVQWYQTLSTSMLIMCPKHVQQQIDAPMIIQTRVRTDSFLTTSNATNYNYPQVPETCYMPIYAPMVLLDMGLHTRSNLITVSVQNIIKIWQMEPEHA